MTVALSILALVATVLAVTALANRIRFSAPLLLMLVGIGLSFLPRVPIPELTSELVLIGFLPPLLYAAAIRTSVIDFRANRRSIAQLSVVLVVVTALGVGLITWLILPVSFPVALALGAVVAPPDAIAATTIARRVGLPRRLVTILEGESLVNDATAITCLRVAIAAIGGTITATQATVGFLIAALGGNCSWPGSGADRDSHPSADHSAGLRHCDLASGAVRGLSTGGAAAHRELSRLRCRLRRDRRVDPRPQIAGHPVGAITAERTGELGNH